MKKSVMVSGMNFGTEFLTNLYKEVVKKGGTEEMVFEALKTNSDLIPKFAEMIVGAGNNVQNLSLKNLEFIANIAVKTDTFLRDSFFKNGSVKLYFWDNFVNWILKSMPDEIPVFEGNLSKNRLIKAMCDSEILKELNNPKPLTIPEFAAIIRYLLLKQPNGENGDLPNNGCANIFHVQLEDNLIVAVDVYWDSGSREWRLRADGLDDNGWRDGHCVFS